ncbi:hydroxymethylglutaryl-CoA synthase [Ruoffia tabacinasalis]|uniref:hydroxymethylglutaryl-CoA synthase n=1 Tax=Ruoffia tabacinasalis TaxID=87458 RepID=UPI003F983F4C
MDQITFHVPNHYVDMVELAKARDIDPNKFLIGIGQEKMAVPTIEEDIVAMAANAANRIVTEEDKELIDQVIFATESGFDFSKSAATYIHQMLGIQPFAKAYEVKHACYGGTAALISAFNYVKLNPERKVLVIMSDISRYGLNSGGEATQGAGAIAMLVTANPRILALDSETLSLTDNQFDFWRPSYAEVPYVQGKYSTELYIEMFNTIIEEYAKRYPESLSELQAISFHLPFTKMGRKCLQSLENKEETNLDSELVERWFSHYEDSTFIGRQVGNVYTGSLYLSLISLLNFDENLEEGQRIGMFSYGSGAVAELFTGVLQPGFKDHISKEGTLLHLNRREKLDISAYEENFEQTLSNEDGVIEVVKDKETLHPGFYLDRIDDHRRYYNEITTK